MSWLKLFIIKWKWTQHITNTESLSKSRENLKKKKGNYLGKRERERDRGS